MVFHQPIKTRIAHPSKHQIRVYVVATRHLRNRYGVDLYRRVRLACHREGLSGREAARRFGIDRKTVTKILAHSVPPG